jgi:hypothetical protein
MPLNDPHFTKNLTAIIGESVTTTIATLFNVSVQTCRTPGKVPAVDDFICCGELIQDDAKAKLMFVFDRDLIERLVNCAFPSSEAIDPAMYESTALEIVNIVSNNLKMYLNVHGYKLQMSIPYVHNPAQTPAVENPMIQLAFSSKDSAVMNVDFYLRTA